LAAGAAPKSIAPATAPAPIAPAAVRRAEESENNILLLLRRLVTDTQNTKCRSLANTKLPH
jgi:hypothetical protein